MPHGEELRTERIFSEETCRVAVDRKMPPCRGYKPLPNAVPSAIAETAL